jgi:AhpD family alkylhydroperoxidase
MERKTRPNRFTEAMGEDVDSAFKKLAAEILKDGELSLKEKSLIAVACAIAVKCDNCTKVHQKQALKLGATQKEIMEAAAVAGLVRMGSGFNTAYALLDDYQPVKRPRFKKLGDETTSVNQNKIIDDKKQENDTEEVKKGGIPTREPDGYITNFYDNNSSKKIP